MCIVKFELLCGCNECCKGPLNETVQFVDHPEEFLAIRDKPSPVA